MTRKFVNVIDHGSMAVFCTGVYNDFEKALGATMFDIYDFKDNYRKEGDFFDISDLEELDCDGGVYIITRFKAETWNEPDERIYYILFLDEADEDKGSCEYDCID